MVDREKIIKGLECCAKDNCTITDICPYGKEDAGYCIERLCSDALALLKEQEARIRELEEKLRALEYGDQDTLKSTMMPAT